jgi:hypothetical protein
MAEFLVLTFDTHNPDPTLDLMAYKLGHIIDIKPDGHIWGSSEKLPKFWIVKVTGLSVTDAQDYISLLLDLTDIAHPRPLGIRKWKLDYNLLPANAKNALNNTGIITVTKAVVLNYLARITI